MPSNSNFPAQQFQESATKRSSPVPGVSPAGAAGIPPDADRTQPNTRIAQNAKAVGGGLEDGSTDFGPDTKATIGGRTTAGTGNSRSTGDSTADTAAQTSPAAAGGNSVLATGRPTQGDSRAAIGAAALPTKSNPDVEDPSGYAVAESTRTASDPSGVGTLGGGADGRPVTNPRQRTTDVTEGKAAPVEGTLPGTEDLNFKGAARATRQAGAQMRQDLFAAQGKPPPG